MGTNYPGFQALLKKILWMSPAVVRHEGNLVQHLLGMQCGAISFSSASVGHGRWGGLHSLHSTSLCKKACKKVNADGEDRMKYKHEYLLTVQGEGVREK